MTINDSFKGGKISPIISLSILNLFSIGIGIAIIVGMLYLFDQNNTLIMQEGNLTQAQRLNLIRLLQENEETIDREIPLLRQDISEIRENLGEGRLLLLDNITKQLDNITGSPPVASQERQIDNNLRIKEALNNTEEILGLLNQSKQTSTINASEGNNTR